MSPIHVDREVWRGDGREVTLDDVTVRWSPLWLLLATVSFDEVHVADATVKVRDTEATPAAPPLPKSLRLPLRVRFHGTTIDRFVFTRSEEAREAAQVRFDGEADWQSWTLSLAESDTPFGRLTGRIEVGADPPFQVNGALDVTRTGDRPLALNVVASGALARNVELDATLRAQTSAADATVVLAPFERQPVVRRKPCSTGRSTAHRTTASSAAH